MAQKDLHNITKKQIALTLQKIGTDTTTNGVIIDRIFFSSNEFIIFGGDVTVALFKALLVLQHSDTDDTNDFVNVPDELVLGDPSLAFFVQANEDSLISLGYIGDKRFIRATIVSTDADTGDGIEDIFGILVSDNAHHVPFAPIPV